MIPSRDHNNKLIISITDGKDLGEIKGLYLDADMRQVTGIFTGKEGIINRKQLAVSRIDIQVFGVDVWLVSGPDVVKPLEEVSESAAFIPISEIRGREIQTDGGTKLCVIDDVILDEEAKVLGFSLSKVYSQGPLAERKAIVRNAITHLGGKDQPMTADLTRAESETIPIA